MSGAAGHYSRLGKHGGTCAVRSDRDELQMHSQVVRNGRPVTLIGRKQVPHQSSNECQAVAAHVKGLSVHMIAIVAFTINHAPTSPGNLLPKGPVCTSSTFILQEMSNALGCVIERIQLRKRKEEFSPSLTFAYREHGRRRYAFEPPAVPCTRLSRESVVANTYDESL